MFFLGSHFFFREFWLVSSAGNLINNNSSLTGKKIFALGTKFHSAGISKISGCATSRKHVDVWEGPLLLWWQVCCSNCRALSYLQMQEVSCTITSSCVSLWHPSEWTVHACDCVICHGCDNMVRCASFNCLVKKDKVAAAVFCCMHEDCKKAVHVICAKARLQKMEKYVVPEVDSQMLYFRGPRHGAAFLKAKQVSKKVKLKPNRKAWTGDPGLKVLINWWTTEGNWDAYCGGKGGHGCLTVSSYCNKLATIIGNAPGAAKRMGKDVRKKLMISLFATTRPPNFWAVLDRVYFMIIQIAMNRRSWNSRNMSKTRYCQLTTTWSQSCNHVQTQKHLPHSLWKWWWWWWRWWGRRWWQWIVSE